MSILHKTLAQKLSSSQYNPFATHRQSKASHKPSPLASKPPISLHSFSSVLKLPPVCNNPSHTALTSEITAQT